MPHVDQYGRPHDDDVGRVIHAEMNAKRQRHRERVAALEDALGTASLLAAEARAEVERLRGVIAEADRHLRNTIDAMRPTEPLPRTVVRAVELTQRDLAAALAVTGEQA